MMKATCFLTPTDDRISKSGAATPLRQLHLCSISHGCSPLLAGGEEQVALLQRGSSQRSVTSVFGSFSEMTDPTLLEGAQAIFGLAALYTIMSMSEWVYHRYFQHLEINKVDAYRNARKDYGLPVYRGDFHVEHHRETLDDMTLDPREHEGWTDADIWRGTAFPWSATVKMTTAVMLQAFPILSIMGWSPSAIIVVVLAAMLFHALAWNTIHPKMHDLPDVPISHGAPSFVLAPLNDSFVFSWIRKNHEGHHRTDGARGNYNVCCPLADHLFGTYVGEVPPAVPASAA